MNKWLLSGLVFVMSIAVLMLAVQAETVWKKEFTDVSDWTIMSDPGTGSKLSVLNGVGAFHVSAPKSEASFVPSPAGNNLVPFDPSKASEYSISWKVDTLTNSMGWDLAVDLFDACGKWIDTVWNIYPETGNCSEKGEFNKNLGGKDWKPEARFIAPKLNIHTGSGSQTAYISYIRIDHLSR